MQAVSKSATTNNQNTGPAPTNSQQSLIKFESLDHFALEKIDLQYNKISFLVIQTVEKLLKNLHQFKE